MCGDSESEDDEIIAVPGADVLGAGPGLRLRQKRAKAIMDTVGACFVKPNLDGPFDFGDLKRCELQRNGLGPFAGHCKWCDRQIGVRATKERYEAAA
jgi:hypothetical protein